MTLFLSKLANDGAALVDVFTIVRCDSALGTTTATNQVDRVTYAKTSSGAGQDRIEARYTRLIRKCKPTGPRNRAGRPELVCGCGRGGARDEHDGICGLRMGPH